MEFYKVFLCLQVVYNLVNHVYAAPNQMVNILDMQEVCPKYMQLSFSFVNQR